MLSSRIRVRAIAVVTVIVAAAACSTSYRDNGERAETTRSAVRTVTEVPGSPGCPTGMDLRCRVTVGVSDQCTPLISITPFGGGTAFTWTSPLGQLVDAVVVSGEDSANVYDYDPPVTKDDDLLVVPQVDGGFDARLGRIDFCVVHDAGTSDAAQDAPADASSDAPSDAASDAAKSDGGAKAW